ncbi:MAG: flagellar motor protein MotB [Opitutaceae bacterium]|nr:flagellar motor protein MotB [Opitutaceae bacterium]
MARKKDAHHGGAWKVAYADFVTAMMALFMVLWISAQDQKILIATSHYFQNPFKSALNNTNGVLPYDTNKTVKDQGQEDGSSREQNSVKQVELAFLNSLAKDFYRLLHLDESMEDKPIDIQVTSDGLRVTLFDRAQRLLFRENTAEFTDWGQFVMQNLAWLIDRHQFRVTIDGHTRSGIPFTQAGYGAWELSSDRANAARRALTYYAVSPALIERVTGYADTRPLTLLASDAESNQRVTLSLGAGRARPTPPTTAATAGPETTASAPPTESPPAAAPPSPHHLPPSSP